MPLSSFQHSHVASSYHIRQHRYQTHPSLQKAQFHCTDLEMFLETQSAKCSVTQDLGGCAFFMEPRSKPVSLRSEDS